MPPNQVPVAIGPCAPTVAANDRRIGDTELFAHVPQGSRRYAGKVRDEAADSAGTAQLQREHKPVG